MIHELAPTDLAFGGVAELRAAAQERMEGVKQELLAPAVAKAVEKVRRKERRKSRFKVSFVTSVWVGRPGAFLSPA